MQIYYTFPDCILQPAYLIENLFSIPLLIYLKTQNLILIEKNNSVKIIQICILFEFGCHIIDVYPIYIYFWFIANSTRLFKAISASLPLK